MECLKNVLILQCKHTLCCYGCKFVAHTTRRKSKV